VPVTTFIVWNYLETPGGCTLIARELKSTRTVRALPGLGKEGRDELPWVTISSQVTTGDGQRILGTCNLNPSYDSAKRWVAPAVQRGLINPGKRQISVPGGGSTLTHHQISSEDYFTSPVSAFTGH